MKIFLTLFFLLTLAGNVFSQEKQKNLLESYEKWYGNATIQNINMSGGWCSEDGFLGIHETTKDIWQVKLNVKFLHPFDDPLVVEELKRVGISIDHFKNFKNIMPPYMNIAGNAVISGFSENTHETRKYCEECTGKDGTWKKNFPEISISVSGDINFAKNEINFRFGDLPKGYNVGLNYWFSSENVKIVELNKIVLSYKYFEENVIDQNFIGELYKVYTKKEILGKDVKVNELIKTDRYTRREIVITGVGEVIVNTNSECTFKEDELLEHAFGELFLKLKDFPPEAFKFRTPTAGGAVRGTRFITKVEKDGTTILMVLDGIVEFSDINKKRTVLVKKNQKSVVKQGGLPSNPVLIKSALIPMWWQ